MAQKAGKLRYGFTQLFTASEIRVVRKSVSGATLDVIGRYFRPPDV